MGGTVSHKGTVTAITPEVTTVRIVSESACSACHARELCSLGDSTEKIVEVPTNAWLPLSVGDEVEVTLKASMGHKAVWLGYAVPLVIMIAVLMTALALKASELAAGLYAIASVAVWYLILWALSGKLKNEYIFNIKK